MDTTPIAAKDNLEVGKIYWFHNNDNYHCICKGKVLVILPHPRINDEKLILYEWFFRGQSYDGWRYDTINTDELETELVGEKLKRFNDKNVKQDNIKW